jgi:hypothetical protein
LSGAAFRVLHQIAWLTAIDWILDTLKSQFMYIG